MLSWRNEFKPDLKTEGFSRLTYELEQQGDMVKLNLIHEMDKSSAVVNCGVPFLFVSFTLPL